VLQAVIGESYKTRPPAPREHDGSDGAVDGNARFYGWECENRGDGRDPWPRVQYEAMVRATAAVCRAHGWNAKSAIGHLEWSDWKVDPRGIDMAQFRRDVDELLAHEPGWSPSITYTVAPGDTLWSIAASKLGDGNRWREIATLNALRRPDAITPGQTLKLPKK
jgi:nucleoid-associated protein YgaU